MTALLALLAVLAGSIGAMAFYLASPNQKLLITPLPLRVGVVAGSVALFVSLLLFLNVAGPATSVYLLLTLVMFVWSVPPLVFGWWRHRGSRVP
jgi:hypothetical protein